MVKYKPTFISIFAGCGGSSLGYKWAGYKELLAIEWDQNAVDTFKLNFKNVPIWQRDIKTVTSKEILDFLNIKKGELDLLDGSPPCQGFSMAGKRKVTDDRNELFKEFVRLIDELQPKVFVMENVSGMIKGKMKGVFIEIIQTLKSLNYNVKVKLMNAMYYNVPQSRQRLIFIGIRKDLNIEPNFPKPSNKIITAKDIISNMNIDKNDLELTDLYKKYWHKAGQGGSVGKIASTKRLRANRPAYSLVKSEGNGGLYHYDECRKLHDDELKALCSFPISFKFIGRKGLQERLGNSVPPKFMQAIAKHIKKIVFDER